MQVNPTKRLLLYVAGVLGVFLLIESGIRARASLFTAASHRTLTKLALLEQQPEVQLLFTGSSRTADGIAPRLVVEELATIDQRFAGLRGFNLASTATSIETLQWLAPRVADRSGLRVAFIEVSAPQLTRARPQFLEPEATAAAMSVEDRLAEFARGHVALVAHRGVLFSDNLGRLPTLLFFGPSLDGSEVMASEQLSAWLGKTEPKARPFDDTAWRKADLAVTTASVASGGDELVEVASAFQRNGVKVVFLVPPLAQGYTDAPERGPAMRALLRQLQQKTQAEVWDWSDARLSDSIFRGSSHLNHEGRAQFARVLARELARSGLMAGRP